MPGSIISDQVYHIFSYSTTISSCIFNAVLSYALIVTKVQQIGPYRWLLLSFALANFCISVSHKAIMPDIQITEFGAILFSERYLNYSTATGFLCNCWWACFAFQTFILLSFHYVYRYVVICNPRWISFFRQNPWRKWVAVALLSNVIYTGNESVYRIQIVTLPLLSGITIIVMITFWGPTDKHRRLFAPYLKDVYDIDLYRANLPGFMAVDMWIPIADGGKEWQVDTLISLAIVLTTLSIPITIIIICINRILQENRAVQNRVSSKTRVMQQLLFKLLLWQTITPCCTTYAPVAIVMAIPIVFQVALDGMGTVMMMCFQLFPLIDPLLVLYFIPRYRAALPRFMRKFGVTSTTITISTSEERNTTDAKAFTIAEQ